MRKTYKSYTLAADHAHGQEGQVVACILDPSFKQVFEGAFSTTPSETIEQLKKKVNELINKAKGGLHSPFSQS